MNKWFGLWTVVGFLPSVLTGLLFNTWLSTMAFARVDKTIDKTIERTIDKNIEIPLGASQVLRLPDNHERIVVGDPKICDAVALSARQLLLIAKYPGETMITVGMHDGEALSYRVVSSVPVLAIQQALREAFPAEDDVRAHSVGRAVFLTGTVSDAPVLEAVMHLAESMFHDAGNKGIEIVNLLQVAQAQQVQVHVRFVEISRTALKGMGFNVWMNNSSYAGGVLGPGQSQHYCLSCDTSRFVGPVNPASYPASTATTNYTAPAMSYLPMITSPIIGSFALAFATTAGSIPISATLGLLESNNIAKTLSEPTLVTSHGQPAKFLVGGEFPIPVPDALGRIIVQFKSYGAQLAFTPNILSQDTVNLAIDAEVSDIDRSSGVVIAGTSVPGIQTRQSSASLRMRDGQSFAIAGLLSDKIFASSDKVPFFGDIPIIGSLLRSIQYQRSELELVILVSLRMVRPVESGEVPNMLREEEFTDPNDLDLFLLGTIDKTRDSDRSTPSSRRSPGVADGPIGFSR